MDPCHCHLQVICEIMAEIPSDLKITIIPLTLAMEYIFGVPKQHQYLICK